MDSNFTAEDTRFMSLALEEAKKSLETGNFPCGAVLVVDGEVVGQNHNQKEKKGDRISHAEMLLYVEHSSTLKNTKGSDVVMYTSLEPCLMCFGAAALHRVQRIVAAIPDPLGNMSKVDGKSIGQFYEDNLPRIQYGLGCMESFEMIRKYLEERGTDDAREYLALFESVVSIYTK